MKSYDRLKQDLQEGSLSRIVRQIDDGVDFAILTAYRDQYSRKENIIRNRELKNYLDRNGLGPQQLIGHWQECQLPGVPWDQCPTDKLVDVEEHSYFFTRPGDMEQWEFRDIVGFLIKTFEQDGAVVRDNGDVFIQQSDGSTLDIGDTLTVGKINQAYSQHIKNMDTPFVFENLNDEKGKIMIERLDLNT